MEKFLNLRNTMFFVTALTLWRLYLSATLQLHPDEAYYWLWSRHLDIAYFDHSPMVAYFIWFTTLLSKSELWVRLSGTLVTLAASVLTWRLAMQMFGSTPVAAGSVILFNAYPLTMLGLIVITPDIPLFLLWASAIYLFWQIVQSNKTWLWYALGLAFGLALLSKYTAILLLPSLLLYLLLTDDRRWLTTPHPWLAMLLGFLCFLPVIIWNSRHGWVSFLFQYHHGFDSDSYAVDRISEFFGSQLLLIGPIAWLLGMYAAAKCLMRKDKAMLLLILSALPVILFFGIISINKLAGPNWTAFAYFSFSILITKYFLGSPSRLKKAIWYGALLSSLLVSAIITLHAKFDVLPMAKYSPELAVTDATNWFYGWRELGADLEHNPDMKFAITPSHQLSAEIIYYTDGKIQAQTEITARPSQFNLWRQTTQINGKKGFYVWTDNDQPGPYQKYLTANKSMNTLTIFRAGIAVRKYRIVPGRNGRFPHTHGA